MGLSESCYSHSVYLSTWYATEPEACNNEAIDENIETGEMSPNTLKAFEQEALRAFVAMESGD